MFVKIEWHPLKTVEQEDGHGYYYIHTSILTIYNDIVKYKLMINTQLLREIYFQTFIQQDCR